MRIILKNLFALFLLIVLTSCGSVIFVFDKESATDTSREMNDKSESTSKIIATPDCDECFIVPRSGTHRDLRYGYYFDQEKAKCVRISYSTGAGCIPPPFETLDECYRCCGGN